MRERLGLNDPLLVQYVRYLGNALRGDFGISITHRRPALEVVLERWPSTLELALVGMGLACGLGILLGMISAAAHGSWLDTAIFGVASLFQSVPAFWIGIMMILFFSVRLRLLPTSGRGGLEHLIMPAIVLSWDFLPRIIVLTRSGILDVAQEHYVTVARAKGLTERMIMTRHIMKNGLGPTISFIGLSMRRVGGGAVITEQVFGWPGIGRLALEGAYRRDLAVVQTATFIGTITLILAMLLVDLVLAYLDPRIRLGARCQ